MMIDLPLLSAAAVAFAVFMYVLLDGFDLGIGILFPWIINKEHRDIMMNSVAPVWDGNETWMVFGAAILYGAFPLAYSILLPALYMPIMVMLSALIFRGVAFEFRFKAIKSRFFWDAAFTTGSTIAAFCQGLILGTFIEGNLSTATGAISWFTPFSIMAGFGVIIGYALLGATWLIMKTEGELQNEMFHFAKIFLTAIIFFITLVSLWTPFIDPNIMHRWFTLPNFYYLAPLPILTAYACAYNMYALFHRYEKWPFILSICLFLFSYIGLAISMWPYLVPKTLTIWQAASDYSSLRFLLVGIVILMPLLLGYTIYAYYIFRGKVKMEHGYH